MTRDRGLFVYQIHMEKGIAPHAIVTKLVRAVWRALDESGGADPRAWPRFHEAFYEVFKRRLTSYKECGTLEECGATVALYDGRSPQIASDVYILPLRGGIVFFAQGLAALAWRRLRFGFDHRTPEGKACRERMQNAVHRALSEHLFYNEACSQCRLRQTPPERRIWNRPERNWFPNRKAV